MQVVPGARSLLGVEDTKVYPIRGQVVLVHAPNVNEGLSVFWEGKQFWHPTLLELLMSDPRYYQTPQGNLLDTESVNTWYGFSWRHFSSQQLGHVTQHPNCSRYPGSGEGVFPCVG
jgi:hypothetical protein